MDAARCWVLAIFFLPPVSLYAYDEVHRCDEFAAHPADPQRWASGVTDDDIVPGPAISFCQSAVNEHPDVARFRFQLARAFWAADRYDDATPLLLSLAKENHAPSLAYLGMALERGLGSKIDSELSKELSSRATAAGFTMTTPAPAMPSPPAEPSFDRTIYNQPGVIGALHDGQFETMRIAGVGQTMDYVPLAQEMIYLSGLHNSFASPISRVLDRDCVLLHKPAVGERLVSRVMSEAFGGEAGMSSLDGMSRQGWGMIGRMMTDLAKGDMGAMMQKERNTELLRQMGEQDGERLLVAHGCRSDVTRRIYANLEAFVTGSSPVAQTSVDDSTAPVESKNAQTLRQQWDERERLREINAARQKLLSED